MTDSSQAVVRGAAAPPFFIVGAGRSGTTLLRLMLDAHPRLAIPPESHFVVGLQRRFGDVPGPEAVEALLAHPRFREWALDPGRVRRTLGARAPASWAELFDAAFSLYAAQHGKARWGDKTPDYARHLAKVRRIFPDARFVHLIRDGRDVAASLARVPWYRGSVARAAHDWVKSVRRARTAGLRRDEYLEVRYEDLVADPETALRRVCAHLGEEWSEAMLDYPDRAGEKVPERRSVWHERTRRPVSDERVGAWRRELTPSDLWTFERVAGDLLDELGYGRAARFSLRGAAAAAIRRAERYGRRAGRALGRGR